MGSGRQCEEERCGGGLVGPSGEAVGQDEQVAERASGWVVVRTEKRKEGKGSRLGQLWL